MFAFLTSAVLIGPPPVNLLESELVPYFLGLITLLAVAILEFCLVEHRESVRFENRVRPTELKPTPVLVALHGTPSRSIQSSAIPSKGQDLTSG